jgi:hypothetical protein
MKGSSMVVKKPSVREMLADPIIRAVMLRDGVTDREVTTAIAKLRGITVRSHMNSRQTVHHEFEPVLPIQDRTVRQTMPIERGRPWKR